MKTAAEEQPTIFPLKDWPTLKKLKVGRVTNIVSSEEMKNPFWIRKCKEDEMKYVYWWLQKC